MRIFTFSINAILLRYISQDMLGVVNVRYVYLLLLLFVCFLVRWRNLRDVRRLDAL